MAGGEFGSGRLRYTSLDWNRLGRRVQVTTTRLHGYLFRRSRAVFLGFPPICSNGKSKARISHRVAVAGPRLSWSDFRLRVMVAIICPALSGTNKPASYYLDQQKALSGIRDESGHLPKNR